VDLANQIWHTLGMAPPKPRTIAAHARRQRAKQRAEEALSALHEAIVDDLDDGIPQKDLVAITGYTRENIRLIAKAVREARAHDARSDDSPDHTTS
jgi:hypothetical protein